MSVRLEHVINNTLRGFAEVWLRCRPCPPDVLVGGLEVSPVLPQLQAPIMLDMCNIHPSVFRGKALQGEGM